MSFKNNDLLRSWLSCFTAKKFNLTCYNITSPHLQQSIISIQPCW